MRVRGDGRTYTFHLNTPRRLAAFSYRTESKTEKDRWIEVELPLDKFVATSFGRVIAGQKLPVSQVDGVGILLGDKKRDLLRCQSTGSKVKQAKP